MQPQTNSNFRVEQMRRPDIALLIVKEKKKKKEEK